MFYFFSKTLTYLLTPAGWLVTALLVAFFTKNLRYRRRFIGVALGIFVLSGNSFLTNELALLWEYPIQQYNIVRNDSTDRVAVVLTGGIINTMIEVPPNDSKNNHRFLLGREADRAAQALYLYKTGVVQKILISGGNGSLPFQPKVVSDEGQMTATFLTMAGVSMYDIVLESKSRNTRENALFSAPMLRQRFRTNQCILVTSAWHVRRAVGCFQKAGVNVTPYPTSFIGNRRSFSPGEWLLPHEESFFDAYYLIREMIGFLMYRVVGYI
ncbi:YdcF family protein [Spirosoma sp. BT702]|uniref:YdcF family protein n=1 Tax=Spirosoma profusum TaxID=2771354 RepID=A0A926XY71_9BACT|nr:YdcF family protein [Spirosoma profusum]MBD2702937.1 YdcF family protein [Spirosoma profusum]